jgi:hypothetical protein
MFDNFDGENYWFRKSPGLTNPELQAKALRYCAHVAEVLNIPCPSLAWFEPADKCEASEQSDACVNAHSNGFSINDAPFDLPCDYFRLPNEDPGEVLHFGFTHRNSPHRIAVRVDLEALALLGIIAHECRHLQQQDMTRGSEWGFENREEAERDAEQFQNEMEPSARQALLSD